MFLSFPTLDIWFCKWYTFFAWIALVPIFIHVRGKSFKDVIFSSFVAGLIGHLLVYHWIGYFGVGVGGGGGYVLVLAFLIPSLTVFFTTKILIAEFLSRRFEPLRIFIYPAVWILVDYIQSIGFLAFPWTYWGYSQFEFTSFIQMASYTGIMGITYFVVIINYALSDFINAIVENDFNSLKVLKRREFKTLIIIWVFLVSVVIYGKYIISNTELSGKSDLRPAIIQSCISPWENWSMNRFLYLRELEYYTNLALNENPDFIIWSESATLEHISYNYEMGDMDDFEQKVVDFAGSTGKNLLTGEIGVVDDESSGRYYPQNNAVLIDGSGRVVKAYSKINLVPFGEWFPYEKWFPFVKEITVSMGGSSFVPGDAPATFEVNGRKFGTLICYEGIFYRLCRKYKMLGADFLVNITNDGWTDSYSGHIQHFSASVFRAIENGIWYLRAGNTGLTALIDPYGRVTKSIPILKKGFLVADVDFKLNHATFFSTRGDIFTYAAMMFIFIVSISVCVKILKKKKIYQN
ncbi:MAG: apolipoprotein N-acyltransferase [Spirochaetes bacterium]|nr:apolipoprotein N-acyltransferase [Spirochaetota bacterium]